MQQAYLHGKSHPNLGTHPLNPFITCNPVTFVRVIRYWSTLVLVVMQPYMVSHGGFRCYGFQIIWYGGSSGEDATTAIKALHPTIKVWPFMEREKWLEPVAKGYACAKIKNRFCTVATAWVWLLAGNTLALQLYSPAIFYLSKSMGQITSWKD